MSTMMDEMPLLDVFGVAMGMLGAAGAVVVYIVQSRRTASGQNGMLIRIQDLFKIRDAVVKDTIFSEYGESLSNQQLYTINKAFARGNEQFISEYLPSLVGKEQAEELRRNMKDHEMSSFD